LTDFDPLDAKTFARLVIRTLKLCSLG
jgi:hypothetical protein